MPEGETQVKAELMEIPIADWSNIDSLEGYPRLYDRRLYPEKLADGTSTYPQDMNAPVKEISFLGGLLHGYRREPLAA